MARRFRELWEIEPWGLIKGALSVLERIWMGRRSSRKVVVASGETLAKEEKRNEDWIGDLRGSGVDWLIL